LSIFKGLFDFEQITPSSPNERGSHMSIQFKFNAEQVFRLLKREGVVCDFRRPSVIRIAPVALYNTFNEVFRFVCILQRCLENLD
jgi:kynureninase